jgi:hypothetical protein
MPHSKADILAAIEALSIEEYRDVITSATTAWHKRMKAYYRHRDEVIAQCSHEGARWRETGRGERTLSCPCGYVKVEYSDD